MTAPITPDERAEWRALADAATPGPWAVDGFLAPGPGDSFTIGPADGALAYVQPVWADAEFIAAARAAVPRLLDALDTAEAEVARLRERAARSARVVTWGDLIDAALRSAPVWDEGSVTEAVRRAVAGVVVNASNWPRGAQAGMLGRDLSAPIDAITAAVLAVVREHLPVSGESRATVQAEALRDAAAAVTEIDGRRDDAAARWLRARADRLDPRGADRG